MRTAAFPGESKSPIADGSVRFIRETIDPEVAEALMTIRGGEAIPEF